MMETGGEGEHILIRCIGCKETACTVSCGNDAVVSIRGDLLVDGRICAACERYKAVAVPSLGAIPPCITACAQGEDKMILEVLSQVQKRLKTADFLPLLTL
ncbi:MAG: hypothetical protein LBQ30_00570 [Treponema sp.]|nr:hypothetical protein [Treponema sp.]